MSKRMTPARRAGRKRHRQRRVAKARILKYQWILSNGPCKCGSTDRLEIDHIVPLNKPHRNIDIFMHSPQHQQRELSKCQVLCWSCHRIKSAQERFNPTHGRIRMYSQHGCRCDLCRAVATEAKRLQRQRKHVKGIPWSQIS